MKHNFYKILAVIMSVCLLCGAIVPAFAAIDIGSLGDILSGKGGNFNVTEWFVDTIRNKANEESAIDKWVADVKKSFNGEDVRDDLDDNEPVRIKSTDAQNAAELLNVTANELKNYSAGFTKEHTENLPTSSQKKLEGFSPYLTALLCAFTNSESLAADMIKSATGQDMKTSTKTKYSINNNVRENISVKGQSYVSMVEAKDIKDVTLDFFSKNRFTLRVNFKNFNSNELSSCSRIFDLPDTAKNKHMQFFGTTMRFDYVDCFAEIEVDKNYNVKSYKWSYTITPKFKGSDGQYSSKIVIGKLPLPDMSGVKYVVSEEYTSFNYLSRVLGDVNGDGKITSTDARIALRLSAGLARCGKDLVKYVDVDGNGKITATDARIILRVSAKLQTMPKSSKVPTTATTYERPQSEKDLMNDLRLLMIAYQSAKDEEEMSLLDDAFNEHKAETTTKKQTETTTHLRDASDRFGDTLGLIGDIINSFTR